MYVITIDSNSTPFSKGWSDPVKMTVGDKIVFSGMGSTCPNPVRPSSGASWKKSYGWIKEGIYNVETVNHGKYGRCVIINNGGACLARFPNVNHKGNSILTEVFIHEGGRGSRNPLWRGSAGCPTIMPLFWEKFTKMLPDGNGVLIIRDSEACKIC
jgi:hypothetical protein